MSGPRHLKDAMRRIVACLTMAVGSSLAIATPSAGQPLQASTAVLLPAELLVTTHARIAASLERIAKRSSLWRKDVDALRGTGRGAAILTPDQVVVVDSDAAGLPQRFDAMVLAEVAPVVTNGVGIGRVLVVVNLALLDRIHSRKGSLAAERDADLDLILVHEVYGHAFPYLLAGNASGRCADPSPGERAAEACSILRENAVRAELGFERRVDYGLNGLLLGRQPDASGAGLVLAVRPPR
jgi:hypothetical protein